MTDIYQSIVDSVAAKVREDFAQARAENAARPIGERRVDVDFYSKADRNAPVSDGVMTINGKTYKWRAGRWCAVLVKWTGTEWKRYRRISGPLPLEKALRRADEEAKRRGLERNT